MKAFRKLIKPRVKGQKITNPTINCHAEIEVSIIKTIAPKIRAAMMMPKILFWFITLPYIFPNHSAFFFSNSS